MPDSKKTGDFVGDYVVVDFAGTNQILFRGTMDLARNYKTKLEQMHKWYRSIDHTNICICNIVPKKSHKLASMAQTVNDHVVIMTDDRWDIIHPGNLMNILCTDSALLVPLQ